MLAFLLILTGCSQEAKAPEPKYDPTRVEVPIPPRREEIKLEPKKETPGTYQDLDDRLDKLQGQLEWARKRAGGH